MDGRDIQQSLCMMRNGVKATMSEDEVSRLRTENAELRRLLTKHQGSGLTPVGSTGACPEGAGSAPPCGLGQVRCAGRSVCLRAPWTSPGPRLRPEGLLL